MAAPDQWIQRGASGGGVFLEPAFSPHNPAEFYVSTDMGQAFHTKDFGNSWDFSSFLELQVSGKVSGVQFTSDPATLFALDTVSSIAPRPTRSIDGGQTWSAAGSPGFASNWNPADNAWRMFVDVNSPGRLIVGTQNKIYLSSDGGQTFTSIYSYGGVVNLQQRQGLHLAGAVWAGNTLYVGTNAGLLVSSGGGPLVPLTANGQAVGGIPANEAIFSFAGASSGGVTRLWAVTADPTTMQTPVQPNQPYSSYRKVYSLDVGQAAWTPTTTGMPAGAAVLVVRTSVGDVSTAYIAGQSGPGGANEYVGKWSAATGTWSSVFITSKQGNNVSSGWVGPGGQVSYCTNVKGLAVAPHDPSRVFLADCFATHLTQDGGANWQAAYVEPTQRHAPGTAMSSSQSYANTGANDSVAWSIAWTGAQKIFAGFDDITAQRSVDGGLSFGFDYQGLPEQVLQVRNHPNAALHRLLAAQGHSWTPQDILGLPDAKVDPYPGALLYSDDDGAHWQTLYDFGSPVTWVAVDPNNYNNIYASVADSVVGGIYKSANGGASFVRMTQPAGTEGRPLTVEVLGDGTVVASFSGRQRAADGKMTSSSGVFYLSPGANVWTDVSHPAMRYWTKDLVVDPTDSLQKTWFAAVNTASNPLLNPAYPTNKPGLYMTTNRGAKWTRVFNLDADSFAVNPSNPNEAYLTSSSKGLWYTSNLRAVDAQGNPAPQFTQLTEFPHLRPNRVFFNPYDTNEVWVATNGAGLLMGNATAAPREFNFTIANQQVDEASGVVTVQVARSGDVANAMSVDYVVSSGSADLNVDFTAQNLATGITGTLTFHAGQATAQFAIPITNDAVVEADETIVLQLKGAIGGNRLGPQASAIVTIVDDDFAAAAAAALAASMSSGSAAFGSSAMNATVSPA
ncbi:MAG TPA: Calx-beta domain-containing protein, partial [Pirellulaceae bacterium]|nr:Calx-beta domain-containing protein [Pirellulaceae bacterium]